LSTKKTESKMRSRWSVLVFSLALTACMTPPRRLASPREFIPANRPEVVWIDRDGKTFLVLDPRIDGEALVGTAENGEDLVSYPLSSLTEVRARQKDKAKTTAFIVGMSSLGVAGLVAAISQVGKGEGSTADTSMPTNPGGQFTGRTHFNVMPLLQYLRR
jgi:hypothetical protein